MTKKGITILSSILIMSLLIGSWNVYLWYHPNVLIKNFENLESDYEQVVNVVSRFYDEQVERKNINIDINKAGLHTLSEEGIEIELSKEEQESLEKVCESSYKVEYGHISITEFDVSFWSSEHIEYAIFYTTNPYETRKWAKKYNSGKPRLKRINKNWYELGEYHR